jgi:hypothetical protein
VDRISTSLCAPPAMVFSTVVQSCWISDESQAVDALVVLATKTSLCHRLLKVQDAIHLRLCAHRA